MLGSEKGNRREETRRNAGNGEKWLNEEYRKDGTRVGKGKA